MTDPVNHCFAPNLATLPKSTIPPWFNLLFFSFFFYTKSPNLCWRMNDMDASSAKTRTTRISTSEINQQDRYEKNIWEVLAQGLEGRGLTRLSGTAGPPAPSWEGPCSDCCMRAFQGGLSRVCGSIWSKQTRIRVTSGLLRPTSAWVHLRGTKECKRRGRGWKEDQGWRWWCDCGWNTGA